MAAPDREAEMRQQLETAIEMTGDVGRLYSRFHQYSYHNQVHFWQQGIREPVAKMKLWNSLGRWVITGSKPYEVYVPIYARKDKSDPESERIYIGSKPVRRVFTYSQTTGPDLPEPEIPGWDWPRALDSLGVREVPFQHVNGNLQGYSRGNEIAINPVAANPNRTRAHELGHFVLGHTTPEMLEKYEQHRGSMEFGAEAIAHLVLKELGMMDDETASHSRGYLQHYLRGERPPETAIREVFTGVDKILRAGRVLGQLAVGHEIEGGDGA